MTRPIMLGEYVGGWNFLPPPSISGKQINQYHFLGNKLNSESCNLNFFYIIYGRSKFDSTCLPLQQSDLDLSFDPVHVHLTPTTLN